LPETELTAFPSGIAATAAALVAPISMMLVITARKDEPIGSSLYMNVGPQRAPNFALQELGDEKWFHRDAGCKIFFRTINTTILKLRKSRVFGFTPVLAVRYIVT
jgi:hypothetical protein